MGTHPLAPSTLDDGSSLESIAGELPYLLKLMAAAQPLSLQTHPDRITAEAGFEREEDLGIPRDSPQRLYRDPFAKPEMLCALTTFDTLCGFRPVDNTISLL
ncbi:MAG: mannose-6-phosphate isomerase, partial [Ilumatobacteraceae bacterium]